MLINQVLETWFPGGRHVEKMLRQTWSTLENRVFETRDASKKYSLKTVPTNYIVLQIGLISHFDHLSQFFSLLFMVGFYHFCNFALNFLFFLFFPFVDKYKFYWYQKGSSTQEVYKGSTNQVQFLTRFLLLVLLL